MELHLIAAMSENRVIGEGRSVPWHHPEDVAHYKSTVAGRPVVVGRRTFDAMDKLDVPLHVVMTTDPDRESDDPEVTYATSPAGAVAAAETTGDDECWVIGGGEIYRLFLPYVDEAVLTHIHETHEGSVTFPELGDDWAAVDRDEREAFDIVTYEHADPEPLLDA